MSVGRAPGSDEVVAGGLERDVRVVIGVLRRVLEPEERRVAVLVERVLDRVGPDSGVGERFLRPQDLPDLGQRARALQMQLGHAPDDAVPGVAEGAKRGPQRRDSGDAKQQGEASLDLMSGTLHGGLGSRLKAQRLKAQAKPSSKISMPFLSLKP